MKRKQKNPQPKKYKQTCLSFSSSSQSGNKEQDSNSNYVGYGGRPTNEYEDSYNSSNHSRTSSYDSAANQLSQRNKNGTKSISVRACEIEVEGTNTELFHKDDVSVSVNDNLSTAVVGTNITPQNHETARTSKTRSGKWWKL